MGWTGTFETRLRNDDQKSPIEFIILTKPDLGGVKWMPSEFIDAGPIGFSSLPPRMIPGMEEAGVSAWGTSWGDLATGGTLKDYRETAQSVSLRTWKPKASSFTFEVVDADDPEAWQVYERIGRGALVEVYAGFADFAFSEYQRINLGVVTQITRREGTLAISCDEAFSKLLGPSVYFTGTLEYPKMFRGAGYDAITNGRVQNNVDQIDFTTTGPVLQYLADKKPGRDYFVIEVADNDEPTTKNVYLRCDASESTSGRIYRTESGGDALYDWFYNRLGEPTAYTVPGTYVIDHEVPFRVYYTPNALDSTACDGLLDCLTRLLTSTGNRGTADMNGDYDTLDQPLGFGLPADLFDRSEARNWHKRFEKRDLDSFKWTPFFTKETDDGWKVIEAALSHFGIWLVMKEGVYTLRSAISHSDDAEGTSGAPRIYDDEIVRVSKHQFFSSSCRVEHSAIRSTLIDHWATGSDDTVYTKDDQSAESGRVVETRPYAGPLVFSTVNGPIVESGPVTPDATTCWPWRNTEGDLYAAEFVTMQYQWYTRIPEVVEVELLGLSRASLAPGDLIRVTAQEIRGPEGYWNDRPAMVQSIRRDWIRGRVTLTIAALPTQNRRYE